MRIMAVKRGFAAAERDHHAGDRRYLSDAILEIVGASQQAQAAGLRLPNRVHVQQQGDDLGRRIGMDATVLAVALAAQRDHRRTPGEVYREFLLDCLAQRLAFQLGGEVAEGAAAHLGTERKAAMAGERRKIGDQCRQVLGPNEIVNDDKIERLTAQRCGPQAIEIEKGQDTTALCAPAGTALFSPSGPSSTAIRADTSPQSPATRCRNSRAVGYQGESSRSSIQRHSGTCRSAIHTGRPSAPARCTTAVSDV